MVVTYEQIVESLSNLKDIYYNKNNLNIIEFDEIFGFYMGDIEPHFNFWCNYNNKVDCFEIICGTIIYSTCHFSNKINLIFRFFDLDQSNSMNIDELTILIMSCIRGMCKLAQIPLKLDLNYMREIENIAVNVYEVMDTDNSKDISLEEFTEWVLNNNDIMTYIEKFTGGTNILTAIAKRNAFIEECEKKFISMQDGFQTISQNQMMFVLRENLRETNDIEIARISSNFGSQRVSKPLFINVMSSLIAFDIVDTEFDKSLSTKEISSLFWLMNGKEPSPKLIETEMKQLDADGSGEVSRLEFILYMTFDPSLKSSAQLIEAGLRANFDKYDTAGNGLISHEKFIEMIKDSIEIQVTKYITEFGKTMLEAMSKDAAAELIRLIDEDSTGCITWTMLKKYANKLCDKQLELIQWVRDYQTDHVARILSFDTDGTNTMNIEKLSLMLYDSLIFFVKNGQITDSYARELSNQYAVKILVKFGLNEDDNINEENLRAHYIKIIKLEKEMNDSVLSNLTSSQDTGSQNLLFRLQSQGIL